MHRDICTPLASSQSPFPEWNDNIYSSDIPEAFSDDVLPLPFSELRVDGGMSNNSLFLQFQSDLLNVPLLLPCDTETTALGAGIAGETVGITHTLLNSDFSYSVRGWIGMWLVRKCERAASAGEDPSSVEAEHGRGHQESVGRMLNRSDCHFIKRRCHYLVV